MFRVALGSRTECGRESAPESNEGEPVLPLVLFETSMQIEAQSLNRAFTPPHVSRLTESVSSSVQPPTVPPGGTVGLMT